MYTPHCGTGDFMNGVFEAGGALFLSQDCLQLNRDKHIRGVYLPSRFFFLIWGLWNCGFYPMNGLYFSLSGGIMLVTANLVWCYLAFKYRNA